MLRTNRIIFPASQAAINSASVEDSATVGCSLVLYDGNACHRVRSLGTSDPIGINVGMNIQWIVLWFRDIGGYLAMKFGVNVWDRVLR
jgi:hypothetical protein